MCGIFGFKLTKKFDNERKNIINKFRSNLYLRGPDSFKYRSIGDNTIGISRLSIVDISYESQPFNLEKSGITAVFNGEIYNYKDLRRSLISQGIKFRSNSEIEVIAYLYKLYREKFVDYLDGMYAIAIFDDKNSSFNIFRDPYGIKPLYWTYQEGVFAFSSNLTSLTKCFGNKGIDLNSVQEYLFHGYCSSNSCIASNYHKLSPSSYLKFQDNVVITRDFESFIDKKSFQDFDFRESNIDLLIRESVSQQISNEVPMGIMLSGGIDSSLLANYLASDQGRPENIKSYSIKYLDKIKSKDSLYAEDLARNLNFEHRTIKIDSRESMHFLEKALKYLDEPIADSGIIGTDIICKKANQDGVKVLLSGTGADELFAGYYRHFHPKYFTSQFFSESPTLIRNPLASVITLLKPSLGKRLVDPITNYFLSVSGMPIDLLESIIRYPIRRDPFFSKYEKKLPNNLSLYFDQKYYLPDSLLAYTDKISMSNSIEVRVPYLSKSLSPNLFKFLDKRTKLVNTKPFIREVSKRYFKKDFFIRTKEGFDASIHNWPDSTIRKLLVYILDYSEEFKSEGIDVSILKNHKKYEFNAYYKNLIFSLYILNSWFVNQEIF